MPFNVRESLSAISWPVFDMPKNSVQLQISSEICSPDAVVKQLASTKGRLDIYWWYEGPKCLPESGALFMKKELFAPLYRLKRDVKLCLYSLRAWGFEETMSTMPSSTTIGEAINRINKVAVECFYSTSFFCYCMQIPKESDLYKFVNDELPKKEWLRKISAKRDEKGLSVSAFLDNKPSVFDCIKEMDVHKAYSFMQYFEAYYLVQESVRRGLSKGQKKIEIAFVLPSDEAKYYVDLPNEIEKMLKMDFGNDLTDIEINISFRFFKYKRRRDARPYLSEKDAPQVRPEEISSYFDFLPQQSEEYRVPFLRDVIHKLNGEY